MIPRGAAARFFYTSMATNAQIVHDKEAHRFFYRYPDGSEAEVTYELYKEGDGSAAVDFQHTFVPEQHRGKSTMSQDIPREAYAWAAQNNLRIKQTCWYLDKVIRHKLEKDYGHLYIENAQKAKQ